jgi:hypothetical protein
MYSGISVFFFEILRNNGLKKTFSHIFRKEFTLKFIPNHLLTPCIQGYSK